MFSRLYLPAIERYEGSVGVIDGSVGRTWGVHHSRVLRLAGALASLGVKPTDRFGIMALNSHRFLEAYHAAFLGAGVVNPLNLRLAGPELDFILRDSGTEVLFVDAFFAEHASRSITDGSPVRTVVLMGDGDVPHDVRYEDLLDAAEPQLPGEPDEDSPVVLMYTGGTTGLPKGVLLEQRAEILNIYHLAAQYGFEQVVDLIQTPMFHAASMASILSDPLSGSTTVTLPAFEPGAVLNLIEKHQVAQTVMVPTMIGMMLGHPEYRPERLRSLARLAYGASPMPTQTLNRLLTDLPEIRLYQAYGMTEASSVLTLLPAEDHVLGGSQLTSVGRPVMGVALCIQAEDGTHLPPGEVGEVCARAGNLMREYWNQPEASREAFRDGWYHTGDAGYLDADGYLHLVDRVKDMIVTGGENVYSAEVENAIGAHPAVAQVAVIGIPSEQWGEQVHAIVVLKPSATADADEIIAQARSQVAGYKVPKSVEFRDTPLPLSGAMKVLKRELREPYWAEHDKRVG